MTWWDMAAAAQALGRQSSDDSTLRKRPMAHLIALDWGTTSLRAYLLDAAGTILERREGGPGIMKVENGAFAAALEAFCGDWIAAHPQA